MGETMPLSSFTSQAQPPKRTSHGLVCEDHQISRREILRGGLTPEELEIQNISNVRDVKMAG